MPKPVGSDQRYMPGLDGLRALAVLTVIAFHEQFRWAPGGLLGVGVFFTLSGYLITDLLLSSWLGTGSLHLADFWRRRARRLLPALFVLLIVVTAWVTIADRARLSSLRGAVGAAATYWSNWYVIIKGQSYFSRFAPPQPLDHLWSLAVEEQFYLIWPWLLLLGVIVLRHRTMAAVRWLALPTLVLAAGSAVLAVALYHPGYDPTRVYEGTDTRAGGLLIGAALAMVWSSSRAGQARKLTARILDVPAFAGLVVILLMVWRVGQYSSFLYRGGFVLLSVATAAALAAAACPDSWTTKVLGVPPLRWLGVRSYGIYLWHYPVIVLTSPANGPIGLPRAAGQIAVSIILAALSWRYVEEPIRHGALERAWRQLRTRKLTKVNRFGLAGAFGAASVMAVAGAGLAGAVRVPATAGNAAELAGGSGLSASSNSVSSTGAKGAAAGSGHGATAKSRRHAASVPAPGQPGWVPKTSCTAVAHIGDSTSDGLVSTTYLPQKQLIPAQYQDVGVHTVYTNVVGARSVAETLPGTINGYDAAVGLNHQGFRGCWVIALGTNDTADVAVGSNVTLPARISRMMAAARGEPVMWVNVISLLRSGPYAETNMLKWNAALAHACTQYPNMRVFNWAAVAERPWFISDGIHYTSTGYAARSKAIATGLAAAFPAGGQRSRCLVSLPPSVAAGIASPSPSATPSASTSPGASTSPSARASGGAAAKSPSSPRPSAARRP
ncbi:MAG TPA: acyltransferase family protein [Streptosporangiaceae bacterium]|jgi:peptidoglycan/LPS O-acetylase OafA/YrhL